MAVKSKEEIIAQISTVVGDTTSDNAIALIEDITDTLQDFETKTKPDGKDWKAEAERIDADWRKKYVERFSSGAGNPDDGGSKPTITKPDYSFDKLFKEGV